MQGTQKVQIQNKRVRYEFELKRNLTVLRGDSATGCLVYFLLGIIAMPLLGLYLMLKKDASDNTHVLGGVLLIVGIIIWIAIAVHSGS